jgi:hypothetical protein
MFEETDSLLNNESVPSKDKNFLQIPSYTAFITLFIKIIFLTKPMV